LADLAGLTIPESQRTFLARLQRYCIEGRYSDHHSPTPLEDASKIIIQEARNIFSWLANQLK
jgi:HEPN domain-containing protein